MITTTCIQELAYSSSTGTQEINVEITCIRIKTSPGINKNKKLNKKIVTLKLHVHIIYCMLCNMYVCLHEFMHVLFFLLWITIKTLFALKGIGPFFFFFFLFNLSVKQNRGRIVAVILLLFCCCVKVVLKRNSVSIFSLKSQHLKRLENKSKWKTTATTMKWKATSNYTPGLYQTWCFAMPRKHKNADY